MPTSCQTHAYVESFGKNHYKLPHIIKLNVLVEDIIHLNLFGFRTWIISCPSPSYSTRRFCLIVLFLFQFCSKYDIYFHLHWTVPFQMRTAIRKSSSKLSLLYLKWRHPLSSFPTCIFLFGILTLPIFIPLFSLLFLLEVWKISWVVTFIEVRKLVCCHYGRIKSLNILSL